MPKLVKCLSCSGVYDVAQNGGYYHSCPEGTLKPRNENIGKDGKILNAGTGIVSVK